MSAYCRPDVEIATFLDDDGRPVRYGTQWDDPPQEAYSRCAHPERFEPVVVVACALLEHVVASYEVERRDDVVDGRATTVLTPAGGGAVLRLQIGGGPLPVAKVAAGFRYVRSWPDCGCDACDDDVADLLDHLEHTVLSIVEGRLSERREVPSPSGLTDEPHRWPAWHRRP